ncbi:MAG: hypothetical protein SLAVMIC_00434 [uncultured marine phage]|uniref:Uncharacterized protein n=1 Tax=uncultured marine phage TaxID=707152 RepID=A0A8D9FQ80_9VIRU|nr:MAG: hypothetical protein SLAVMIC_00434 [uncultured marine phage]
MKHIEMFENYHNPNTEIERKVYNMIAERLGWGIEGHEPFDHMMESDGVDLDPTLKKAINMLCDSYRVSKIFIED